MRFPSGVSLLKGQVLGTLIGYFRGMAFSNVREPIVPEFGFQDFRSASAFGEGVETSHSARVSRSSTSARQENILLVNKLASLNLN
jgi:hypothetical protein